MNDVLHRLHAQVVYVGSAAVVAYLAVLMTGPSAQQPPQWALVSQADETCLVDESSGTYAAALEGQPVCVAAKAVEPLPIGD